MKSLITLLVSIIRECGDVCSVDTTKDIETVLRRFEHQGRDFLTHDLPSYERGLLTSLANMECSPDFFPLFKKRQKTPIFLGGFMDLIFDRVTGAVLDDVDPEVIRCVRQISLLFKKIELPCTEEVKQRAFDRYVECDIEVGEWEKTADAVYIDRFVRLSSLLFSRVFMKVNDMISLMEIVPRHGPGATADKKIANAKFEYDEWTDILEDVFPFWRYCTPGAYQSDRLASVYFREPGTEMAVQVIDVPKTQDAPRIIAIEPSYMQYMQQGISSALNTEINRSFLYDFISTEYQEPNQRLAREGSLTGALATLDLSEASDRVSSLLVSKLFSGFPHLLDGVFATRSGTAEVPGHGLIPLSKFASMGSALCFPVETMVFFTVVMLGIEDAHGIRFKSVSDIMSYSDRVRVYGDDIVCPTDAAASVSSLLELFGFKVNESKSFWTGRFRESCGKEYYLSNDVTVARVRREFPLSRKNVSNLVSLVDFRNQLYERGFWKTAFELDEDINALIPFPAVSETSVVLGRRTFLPIYGEYRTGGGLQRPLVKGAVVRYRKRKSTIADEAALMKCLGFKEAGDPYGPLNILDTESDHLMVGGRPDASSINIRWAYAD